MFRSTAWQALVLIIAVVFGGQVATAQTRQMAPLPQSRGAQVELDQFRAQAIGQGYTVASLNQIALRNAMANVPNVGQVNTPAGPRGVGGSPLTGPISKPFSSFSPEPTVSPYLNLFREGLGNSDFNYNTLVRPQLQQQQFNQTIQRQNMELARRLQSLSAQPDFNPQGSEQQFPTGHTTTYMYYGRYYPMMNARRR